MRRNTPLRDSLAPPRVVVWLSALALIAFTSVTETRGQVSGARIYAPDPKTPLEFWDAADYLVRTGQPAQAVPYLNAFLKANPDDATLLQIRDRHGVGSILRLEDDPATRRFARTIADRLAVATRRNATRPERIERFVAALTKSREEQDYGVERLREAGSYAVPALVQALGNPGLSADDHASILRNMGRLDRSAVPALIASLDSKDPRLAANVADVLGRIGDPRAIPHLTFPAAHGEPVSPVRAASRRAIASLTRRPFEAQPRSPVRVLLDEARKYHVHAVNFPGDSVLIWAWDEARNAPVTRQVTKSEAEASFGLRLAREALQLDPTSRAAQALFVGLALEKAVERSGFAAFPASDPSNAFATAVAAGPDVLGDVLEQAVADGKADLAAAAATALGQVTDRNTLTGNSRPQPLVKALWAPGRRAQFAAARALVTLDPRGPFPGSSRVVPVLARFVTNQAAPKAVIIDGNVNRASQLAGFLKTLGYEPQVAETGDRGFRLASESADVELILIDPHFVQGHWRLVDTLGNLRGDARTAAIPTFVVGPRNVGIKLDDTFARFPGVKYLITPTGADILERQLGGRPSAMPEAERAAYAREAAALLAMLSSRAGSPFEADLGAAEPALAIALNSAETSESASVALGDVPVAAAQRGLADVVLDPSKPAPLRLSAAAQLARSLQRFGPLLAADQEAKLVAALDGEADPALRTALATALGALRPKAAATGRRLQDYRAPAADAPGAPGPDAEPPAVSPAPPDADAPAPPDAEAPAPPADDQP